MKATYTQWSVFKRCPYWYHQLYITKACPRQKTDALVKGIRIHDALEAFVKKESDTIPEEVHPSWTPFLKGLRNRDTEVATEVKVSNDVAYGKLDIWLPEEGVILDYKTGKCRKSDIDVREQIRFYVWLVGRSQRGQMAWVEHPQPAAFLDIPVNYSKVLDKVWRRRIDDMQSGDTTKTPGWTCKYCPVTDCEHNLSENTHEQNKT